MPCIPWARPNPGDRYQSNKSDFHDWSNMGPMVGKGEHGGQWWVPVPNQADGSPPPAGVPNYLVNVGGGDLFEVLLPAKPLLIFTTVVESAACLCCPPRAVTR